MGQPLECRRRHEDGHRHFLSEHRRRQITIAHVHEDTRTKDVLAPRGAVLSHGPLLTRTGGDVVERHLGEELLRSRLVRVDRDGAPLFDHNYCLINTSKSPSL
jgi:hypothetical protein